MAVYFLVLFEEVFLNEKAQVRVKSVVLKSKLRVSFDYQGESQVSKFATRLQVESNSCNSTLCHSLETWCPLKLR